MPESPGRTVYFEHRRVGAVIRTAAICGETGIEVVVMGPAGASPHDLERLALRKLERRLAQAGGEGGAQDPDTGDDPHH
jgi:hypothetical protein